MAKDKTKKNGKKSKKAAPVNRKARADVTKPKKGKAATPARGAVAKQPDQISKVARAAKDKAVELASSPVVAEVVAAALVATAAALKNPKKARAMAEAASDELGAMAKSGAKQSGAFWQLALDVARRSIDSLGADAAVKGAGGAKRKKG